MGRLHLETAAQLKQVSKYCRMAASPHVVKLNIWGQGLSSSMHLYCDWPSGILAESRTSSIIQLCWHKITNPMWEFLMLIDPTQFKKYFFNTMSYINFQVKVPFQIPFSTTFHYLLLFKEKLFLVCFFFHINHCKSSEKNHRINSNLKNFLWRKARIRPPFRDPKFNKN